MRGLVVFFLLLAGLGRAVAAPRTSEGGVCLPGSTAVRAARARQAGLEGDRSAASWLLGCLRDPEGAVRRWAAESLGLLGAHEAIEGLRVLLGDQVPGVRAAAAEALGMLGDRASAGRISRLLADLSPVVQRAAVEALGALGAVTVAGKIAKLAGSSYPEVRLAALRSLLEMKAPEAGQVCSELLGDRVWRVRDAAARGLTGLGVAALPYVRRALASAYWLVRAQAAEILGRLPAGPEDIQALLKLLGDSSSHVRYAAAEALGRLGSVEAGPALEALLRDPDPFVREAAIRACGRVCTSGAAPAVARLLRDPSPIVRMWAATALGKLGGAEAVKPLGAASQDPKPYVRQAAVEALGRLGVPGGIEILALRTSDPDEQVRRTVGLALARYGGRALPALAKLVSRGGLGARQTALWALARIRKPEAVRIALSALGDPDWGVSAAASQALVALGALALPEVVAASRVGEPGVRVRALRVLGRMGAAHQDREIRQSILDVLEAALDHGPMELRIAAARALGDMACEECLHRLSKTLRTCRNGRFRTAVKAALDAARVRRAGRSPQTHPSVGILGASPQPGRQTVGPSRLPASGLGP